MTPELQELIGLRFIVLLTVSVVLSLVVSWLRASKERDNLRRAGQVPTTLGEVMRDTLYGTLAAVSLLLIQDSIKPLQIKAAMGLAMVYGSIGPPLWSFAAGLISGKYGVSLTKKEGPNDGNKTS